MITEHDQKTLPHNPPRQADEAGGFAHVLKDEQTFVVVNGHGDIRPGTENGLYHGDTRYLSGLVLQIEKRPLIVLHTTVRADNLAHSCKMTNPDLTLHAPDAIRLGQGTLQVTRTCTVAGMDFLEQVELTHFGGGPVELEVTYGLAADFKDVFEVRGVPRPRPGPPCRAEVRPSTGLFFEYVGRDEVPRTTLVTFERAPDALKPGGARFTVRLVPGQTERFGLRVTCHPGRRIADIGSGPEAPVTLTDAMEAVAARRHQATDLWRCRVKSSNPLFDRWLERSRADLAMLVTEHPHGHTPHAGLPWFSAVFGRDALITSLQTLWVEPRLAAGTLRVLAAEQATEVDPVRDAEPGKIIHELRGGEMAALNEHPFGRYYGSIDSTPLFCVLAAAYHETTGDRALIETIWPALVRALEWLERWGDRDGDGFIEYPRSPHGLLDQGWKDSPGCIAHADGSVAQGDIALCEVQGYAYEAWMGASRLAASLGLDDKARVWRQAADRLRERFLAAFWCDELDSFALALDGDKRPCRVRASNAGHCLRSGIVRPEQAAALARSLFEPDMFSGWGIRTLSARQVGYNPMSYHNGAVWPHESALIADGLARHGMTNEAAALLDALFEAAVHLPLYRLPELLCGFRRLPEQPPTPYPSACSPQAWAAGAPFQLLSASLGLSIDGPRRRVRFWKPRLPADVDELEISNLLVNDASMDLVVHRHRGVVGVSATRVAGQAEVLVIP